MEAVGGEGKMREGLAREKQYFEGHFEELLEKHEGDFIAIKGDEVLCVVGFDNWCEMTERDDVLVEYVWQWDGIHTNGIYQHADIQFPTVDEIRDSAGAHSDHIVVRFI